MNSSQDINLAIVFSTVLLCLLTFQGCSTIESVFDGSIFSDSTQAPVKEPSEARATDPTTEGKTAGIKDLKNSTQTEVKPLSPRKAVTNSQSKVEAVAPKSIEIMWQVPTEPVEAYHIYLLSGAMDPKDEKRHLRVLVSTLKKEDDPTYGPVYKYQIPGNLTANTIQIRAENRFGMSEPSEPMIVQK